MNIRTFCLAFLAGTALFTAKAETFSAGNLNFEIMEGNTCRLIASPAAAGTVTLPSALTYENVEYTLTELSDGALADARGLEALLVPGSVTAIGSELARGCSALRIVELAEGVTTIGAEAFAGCSALESVVLPDNLAEIPRRCFYGASSLRRVHIGAEATSIGTQAFDACGNLSSVVCNARRPPQVGAYAFDPAAIAEAVLTVPSGCRAGYAAEPVWGAFRSIAESDYGDARAMFTLVLPDGSVSTREALGARIPLTLTVPDGWTIDRLTFNDTDVSGDIGSGGAYTTPPLTRDSILRLTIRSAAGAGSAEAPAVKARRAADIITVEGLAPDAVVRIYTIDGRLLYRSTGDCRVAVSVNEPVVVVAPGLKFIL